MVRISALNVESRLVKLASSEEREKWINKIRRKVKYLDKIPVSGKTPKTPEKSKNEVVWKASQKFSKIINII